MTIWDPKQGETFRVETGELCGFCVRSNRNNEIWAFFDHEQQAEEHRVKLEQDSGAIRGRPKRAT